MTWKQSIPVVAARSIAEQYGWDQVVIIARKVDPNGGEHVTTYGRDKANCDVAARIGDHLKYKIMGWVNDADADERQHSALYRLLVERGYAQHEADQIARGPVPETSAAPSCPPCQLELGGKRCGDCGYAAETVALCPHGMPLAENVCGPCSEGRPNIVTRTVWTKSSESDPYCVHCGKTWDAHLCDGFNSCPTAKTPVKLSPSEAASFDKALARSPRRVSETPADLVGALQDRAHIDAGPFRPARSVKEAEPARPCYASGVAGICRLPAGHDGTHAFS